MVKRKSTGVLTFLVRDLMAAVAALPKVVPTALEIDATRIEAYVAEHHGCYCEDVVTATGIERNRAQSLLSSLTNAGALERWRVGSNAPFRYRAARAQRRAA